jgi:hypothetical protein
MPVVANEAAVHGYETEDLGLEAPRLTFYDGVDVVELLKAAYQSAEQERTLAFPPEGAGCVRAGGTGEGQVTDRATVFAILLL